MCNGDVAVVSLCCGCVTPHTHVYSTLENRGSITILPFLLVSLSWHGFILQILSPSKTGKHFFALFRAHAQTRMAVTTKKKRDDRSDCWRATHTHWGVGPTHIQHEGDLVYFLCYFISMQNMFCQMLCLRGSQWWEFPASLVVVHTPHSRTSIGVALHHDRCLDLVCVFV